MLYQWIVLGVVIACAYVYTPVPRRIPSVRQTGIEYAVLRIASVLRSIVGTEQLVYALLPFVVTAAIFTGTQVVAALGAGQTSFHALFSFLTLCVLSFLYCLVLRISFAISGNRKHVSSVRGVVVFSRIVLRHSLFLLSHVRRQYRWVLFCIAALTVPAVVVSGGGLLGWWFLQLIVYTTITTYGTLGMVALVCGNKK